MALDRTLVAAALQGLLSHPTRNAVAKLDGADATHRESIAKNAVQIAAEAQAASEAYDAANAPSKPDAAEAKA